MTPNKLMWILMMAAGITGIALLGFHFLTGPFNFFEDGFELLMILLMVHTLRKSNRQYKATGNIWGLNA
ncbi:MAG: hypothetical protein AABX70_05925 [Nanoarchaeota archaeon]